ncbi:DUF4190 domain-containing protein [Microbacterium sp. cf046]|uniref:DUF4190 domain-containing protein n=1 Tax=Microbacterium sp. cf046 TaxID=1761803 RepID=UPI0020C91C82|nr:DUF4190 domain-containing protein [Microbacterium sp. cf046]
MSDTNPDGSTPVPPAPPAPPAYGSPDYAAAPPAAPAPPAYTPAPPAYTPAPPAYGTAPAYGAAPAYGTSYGAYAPAKTNTLAIVSLVSSLVGIFIIPFLGSLAGIITGHMSLGQIKRTGEQGRGLALAGTILGYVGLGFIVLGLIVFFAFLLPLIIYSAGTNV